MNVLGVTFSNLVTEFELSEASLNRAVDAPSLVYVSTHRICNTRPGRLEITVWNGVLERGYIYIYTWAYSR